MPPKKEAIAFGGGESDYSEYTRPDPSDTHYSDKRGHRERSIAHDPRPQGHIKHEKKRRQN